ncbi:hypothetical protein F4X10_16065 [Candidatus Poribacteria bacterium]|nr:hypothetical protein [Candidatus Poribacteria bacterium]
MIKLNWQEVDRFGNAHQLIETYSKYRKSDIFGVYIIWEYKSNRKILYKKARYIGEGLIGTRLYSHRNRYRKFPKTLYVTWSETPKNKEFSQSVEQYLHDIFNPPDSRAENKIPIKVNLPSLEIRQYTIKSKKKNKRRKKKSYTQKGNIPELKKLIQDCVNESQTYSRRVPSRHLD